MVNIQDWIGRQEQFSERLDESHVARIAATFNQAPLPTDAALPLLWHYAFFQKPVPMSEIGTDGHPERGGFMPPADNRNRMWAGSRVQFLQDLSIGAMAKRVTTIEKITEKQGRTGALLFVTLRHDYSQNGQSCIVEEQDIVYRQPSPPKLGAGEPCPTAQWREVIQSDSVQLFRYSAVTFNGHRIHYDFPYVHDEEGYPNLVVHGPLIATLVLQAFIKNNPDKKVTSFSYRGLRPLIHPVDIRFEGQISEPGRAKVWAGNDLGIAQTGEIHFI